MYIELVGGPAAHGYRVLVPVLRRVDLPPYVCTGDHEPFQHFVRPPDREWGEGVPVYPYAGECRTIAHEFSYPHTHEELGWEED